jgi:peptide/nickel transport system ATP-binding protein
MSALLEVQDLRTLFSTDEGAFFAVDGVSFTVQAGRTLGIVGESGCGKSVSALSIIGRVPSPPGRVAGGAIRFEGRELVGAPTQALQVLRGNGMAMIFQEPMSALNRPSPSVSRSSKGCCATGGPLVFGAMGDGRGSQQRRGVGSVRY